ncbi:MAG: hypothetical protein EXR72_11240 [Myxococcales bacterium]|nr:hypothetical protein [Myxococcales bacterium]
MSRPMVGSRRIRALVTGALLFAAGAAHARPAADEKPAGYAARTHVNFLEGDEVEGELQRPGGEVVDGRRPGKQISMIVIRDNFIAELRKSADRL